MQGSNTSSLLFARPIRSECDVVCLVHQGNMDVLSESLDITGDLLARFGNVMSGYHSQLRVALLPHLEETRPIVRKRAIQCMGELYCLCGCWLSCAHMLVTESCRVPMHTHTCCL